MKCYRVERKEGRLIGNIRSQSENGRLVSNEERKGKEGRRKEIYGYSLKMERRVK